MILGLSHAALTAPEFGPATDRLIDLGYSVEFDAPRLRNNTKKAQFLTTFREQHHIRGFRHATGLGIELLDHGSWTTSQSALILPILAGPTPPTDFEAVSEEAFPVAQSDLTQFSNSFGFSYFFDPVLRIHLLWTFRDVQSGLVGFLTPTTNIGATEQLLGNLRFRPASSGEWRLPTISQNTSPFIAPVRQRTLPSWDFRPRLDALGFNCLAFMAQRGTFAALDNSNFRCVSFPLSVNHRNFMIGLIETEMSPIVEVLEDEDDY